MSAELPNDGGAAFPLGTVDGYCTDGMSMRDYFAAAALPAIIEMIASKQFPSKSGQPWTENMISQQAFAFADAMLKARACAAAARGE
jgi:hypothetical protein